MASIMVLQYGFVDARIVTLLLFEFWVALANDINAAAAFHHLAIRMAVFQSANTTYNFHRIDLVGRIV